MNTSTSATSPPQVETNAAATSQSSKLAEELKRLERSEQKARDRRREEELAQMRELARFD